MQCREAHNNDAVQNREWQQEVAECRCLHAYVLWCCLLCLSMFVALRRIHSNKTDSKTHGTLARFVCADGVLHSGASTAIDVAASMLLPVLVNSC